MDAQETCESVLKYIKKTNLNWNIVESPFSVTITLRKTFIKKKDGSFLKSGLTSFTQESSSAPPYSPNTFQLKPNSTTRAKTEPFQQQQLPPLMKAPIPNPIHLQQHSSQPVNSNMSNFKQQSFINMDFLPMPKTNPLTHQPTYYSQPVSSATDFSMSDSKPFYSKLTQKPMYFEPKHVNTSCSQVFTFPNQYSAVPIPLHSKSTPLLPDMHSINMVNSSFRKTSSPLTPLRSAAVSPSPSASNTSPAATTQPPSPHTPPGTPPPSQPAAQPIIPLTANEKSKDIEPMLKSEEIIEDFTNKVIEF